MFKHLRKYFVRHGIYSHPKTAVIYSEFGHTKLFIKWQYNVQSYHRLLEKSRFIGTFLEKSHSSRINYYRYEDCMIFGDTHSMKDRTGKDENGNDHHTISVEVHYKTEAGLERLKKLIDFNDENENKVCIDVIEKANGGLRMYSHYFDPNPTFDIKKYNFDAEALSKSIKPHLGKAGLIIFHGEPGTGKTSLIKHIMETKGQKFIYLPPNLGNALSDPSFISTISSAMKTVMIIEDGENIMMKREKGSNQAVSNILNMSNGILGDVFNITFIVTFNKDISQIDPALLRNGRLKVRQEFGKLENGKTVAEITNDDPVGKEKVKESIGFRK